MRKKFTLFHRSNVLESEIENFLQKLSESAIIYKMAVSVFLKNGANDNFSEKLQQLCDSESKADALRRSIENKLYQQTLIPDARGDVLGLLESLDQIHGLLEGGLFAFSIEKPDIPENLNGLFLDLTDVAVQSVEYLVLGSKEFFTNIEGVANHLHKVMFFEKEADKIGTKLKRMIFDSKLSLAEKTQLKYFAEYIDNVADGAEDVSDRLGIYAIKRVI